MTSTTALLGYAQPWVAHAGKTVDLKISSNGPEHCDLVIHRVVCADIDPRGPGPRYEAQDWGRAAQWHSSRAFGRFAMANRRARGERRPETFNFLGFTHYCRTTRKGRFGLGRKPQAKRMQRTLTRIGQALRRRRHDNPEDVALWLRSVIGGWLRYFAVPSSFPFLSIFVHRIKRLWFQQLRRRSQKAKAPELWLLLDRVTRDYFPAIRIMHPWPAVRFAAVHTRGRSPVR